MLCACEKTGDVQPRLTFPRESRPGMRTERIPVWKPEPLINTGTGNKTALISYGHQVALHTRCQIQQFFKPGAFFSGFFKAETKQQNKTQVGPGRTRISAWGGGVERGGEKKKPQNLPSLIMWAVKTLENPLVFGGFMSKPGAGQLLK